MINFIYRILLKIDVLIKQKKNSRLKKKMGYCGQDVKLDHSIHILVPQAFEIGDNSSISSYTTIYATFGVKIGKNCLISSNCGISSYNHITNSQNRISETTEDKNYSKPVVIGDNVWIAMNCCILPGVNIGNNSIIGAGSVVIKDVPENEIWAGNPARFIKKLSLK